jgi:hypothetical protein
MRYRDRYAPLFLLRRIVDLVKRREICANTFVIAAVNVVLP